MLRNLDTARRVEIRHGWNNGWEAKCSHDRCNFVGKERTTRAAAIRDGQAHLRTIAADARAAEEGRRQQAEYKAWLADAPARRARATPPGPPARRTPAPPAPPAPRRRRRRFGIF